MSFAFAYFEKEVIKHLILLKMVHKHKIQFLFAFLKKLIKIKWSAVYAWLRVLSLLKTHSDEL